MKLNKIIKLIETKYPISMQEDWDNCGLIIGNSSANIKKIQLSIDLTREIVGKAINEKVDLIITHHPAIWKKINKVTNATEIGTLILKLISNNISVYSMHTNLDSGIDGLNDYFFEKLGILESKILVPQSKKILKIAIEISIEKKLKLEKFIEEKLENKYLPKNYTYYFENNNDKFLKLNLYLYEYDLKNVINMIQCILQKEVSFEIILLKNINEEYGIGRFAKLENSINIFDYIQFVKEKLNIKSARLVCLNKNKSILKIAVITGSGMSLLTDVMKKNIDLLITSDVKHHEALIAMENDLAILDVGHFESEIIFTEIVEKYLKLKFEGDILIYNGAKPFDYV